MSASRDSSAGPTPFNRSSGMSRISARVSGGSPVGTGASLHAHEVGIQRLAAVVELDFQVRERVFDVFANALGVLGRGVAPDEHGDDLAVVVDEHVEQFADGIGGGSGGPHDTLPRARAPSA